MKGGYRPGAGRPKGARNKNRTKPAEKVGNQSDVHAGNLDPLEFLLQVMRDPGEDRERRVRAAIACLPYTNVRAGEVQGKKQAAGERARLAGVGKFRASAPPQLKVVK